MSEQSAAPGRGLFGYKRAEVDRMISERDAGLREAEARATAAEGALTHLQSEVARLEGEVTSLREELSTVKTQRQGGEAMRFVHEELATMLASAEVSATRIIERARVTTRQQAEVAERAAREAEAGMARLTAWRQDIDPFLRNARTSIEETRFRIEEVPMRVREALSALVESVTTLQRDLAHLESAGPPPFDSAAWTSHEAAAPPLAKTEPAEPDPVDQYIPGMVTPSQAAEPIEIPDVETSDQTPGW